MAFYNENQAELDFGYKPTTGPGSVYNKKQPAALNSPEKPKSDASKPPVVDNTTQADPNQMRGTESGAYDGLDVSEFANLG